ncbi:HlyD family efflux transporter periplasmic adaptor subunit [Niabella sp. CJ426]|uniref:HlyD family efflux transporter periplasmic adaptor subunit n=1 Tax=Niabella sp. CJ426 TaxID=3393740 RepID=UPI003D04564C
METNSTNIEKYHKNIRSEEIQDIIDRMPTKFASRTALIIIFLISLLFIFGWAIRYPDVISGDLSVNTPVAPIKLVSNANGKILLIDGIKSRDSVSENEAIAVIQNGLSYDTLLKIKYILQAYDPANPGTEVLSRLPPKISLGELNKVYYTFISNVHQLYNFNTDQLFDKQIAGLRLLNLEQGNDINNSTDRVNLTNENKELALSSLKRDSVLYYDKVSAAAEFEKSKQQYLSNRTNINNATSSLINARKEARQTSSKIIELVVQKKEKKRELELNIDAAYHDLIDNIKLWEQKYLITAPFDGRVQFLKFWTDNQFVQQGEPVFTVVPKAEKSYGQVLLPAIGAGKVEVGQEVIIKLNDFPYNEYGSIKASVSSISLTSNSSKTDKGDVETYLITLNFDNGMVTNYGKKLDVKHEAKGTAEIITKDRRLIERFFDNLKYAVKK